MRKSRRLKGQYKPSAMEQGGVAPGIALNKMLDPAHSERLIWHEQGGGDNLSMKTYTFLKTQL